MRTLILLIFSIAPMMAATVYQASLSTAPLGTGTYYLDFQFISGDDSSPNGNNVFSLFNIDLGTGSLTGAAPNPDVLGDVSGSLASGYTLADTQFFNEVLIRFTPGDLVRFDFSYTGNFTSGVPDSFSFLVLDEFFNPIVSTGTGASLQVDITGPDALPQVFAASSDFDFITPEVREVPEPSTSLLLVAGAGLLTLLRRTTP